MEQTPVILGTGIGGLSASFHLSQSGIDHVLVGPAPAPVPRLGESLDIPGTVDLWTSFGQFSRHFYPKSFADVVTAQSRFHCGLQLGQSAVVRGLFGLGRRSAPGELLHLERVGFDRELFDWVTRQPPCRHVAERAERVEYDAGSDRVTRVHFAGHEPLSPSFVLDCTVAEGPVARAAGLKPSWMGKPQSVAFCHYHRRERVQTWQELRPHERQTNLIRLYADRDGIDAFGWCIPVGHSLSVGVAMDQERELPAEEALERFTRALEKLKLPYLDEVGSRTAPQLIRHRYFTHDRIYGSNFLLAGPAACQVWYMTGSGVGAALLAGRLLPKILHEPRRYCSAYHRYLKYLTRAHATFERLRHWDADPNTRPMYQRTLQNIARSNFKRAALYFGTLGSPIERLAWEGAYRLSFLPGALTGYCDPAPQPEHTPLSAFSPQPAH